MTNFKKFIVSSCLLFTLFLVPMYFVGAQQVTPTQNAQVLAELNRQINSLLAMVAQLQAQLTRLVAEQNGQVSTPAGQQAITVELTKSDIWTQGAGQVVTWSPVNGDFDYYQIRLANHLTPGNTSSLSVKNNNGVNIPKNWTSASVDGRNIDDGLIQSWISNARSSGYSVTEENLRRNFYISVIAEKQAQNSKGNIIASGNSQTITIVRSNTDTVKVSATITTPSTLQDGLRPTIAGTVYATSTIGISVSDRGGKIYGSGLIRATNGKWQVQLPFSVSADQSPYTIQVHDSNNNLLTTGTLTAIKESLNKVYVSTTFIGYNYTIGDSKDLPGSQIIVTNGSSKNVNIKIQVPNQPSWLASGYNTNTLTIGPGKPMGIGVHVNPSGLSAGSYKTQMVITGNFSDSPINIPITLNVYGQPSLNLKLRTEPLYDKYGGAFIKVYIVGSKQNANVKSWESSISCPAGVIVYGKNNENICGQVIKPGPWFDQTKDILLYTASVKNTLSSNNSVGFSLIARDAGGQTIDKTFQSVSLPASPQVEQSITVLSPNGGETYKAGDPIPLRFKNTSTITRLAVGIYKNEQKMNSFVLERTFNPGNNSHSFYPAKGSSFNTEDFIGSFSLKVCDYSQAREDVCDYPVSNFTIVPAQPSISITSPSGGETILNNGVINIKYTTVNMDQSSPRVQIAAYLRNMNVDHSGPIRAQTTASNSGTIQIDLSNIGKGTNESAPLPGKYQIILCSTNLNTGVCAHGNEFTITAVTQKSTISLVSPAGGEVWNTGSTQEIRWNTSDKDGWTVDINLRNETPGIRRELAVKTPNDGSETVTIPSTIQPGKYFIEMFLRDSNGNVVAMERATGKSFEVTTMANTVSSQNANSQTASALTALQSALEALKGLVR